MEPRRAASALRAAARRAPIATVADDRLGGPVTHRRDAGCSASVHWLPEAAASEVQKALPSEPHPPPASLPGNQWAAMRFGNGAALGVRGLADLMTAQDDGRSPEPEPEPGPQP